MKKVLIVCSLAIGIINFGFTQAPSYGVKLGIGTILAGVEITEVGDEEGYFTHEVKFTSGSAILQGGAFFNKKFGVLFFQSDLLYTKYSMNYEVSSPSATDIPSGNITEHFHYIDFGIRAGLTANGFSIGVGPTWHRNIGHTAALDFIPSYSDKVRTNSYGFVGLLMYEYERYVIEVKYEKTFRSIGDHIYYKSSNANFLETPDQLSLLVGYAF